jgi:dTDP-4-amino-4,6-dideoxygalactose transaminase
MKVPLLDLTAQYRPIRGDVLAAIERVCDTQQFILGPEVEAFETEMASRLGVAHAIGVSSGTDALLVSMMALDIGAGDEVITSSFSFFASAGSVARLGARPVLVDIDPRTFNLDAAAVAGAVGPRTRAIMPVHLFGAAADLAPILETARRADLPVIEDACQSMGARYAGRFVGTFGAVGCFSFFPSKNLGAFGDAGLVVTNDGQLAGRVRALRMHGETRRYHHEIVGGNFRLDAIQAAILRVKAPHLERWTAARRANAGRYDRLFQEAGLVPPLVLPAEPPGCVHGFNQYVIRAPRRDDLRTHLEARGVGTAVYYPVPLHLQACFADLGYREGSCPRAETAAREALALPIYGELAEEAQQYVVHCMAEVVEAEAGP